MKSWEVAATSPRSGCGVDPVQKTARALGLFWWGSVSSRSHPRATSGQAAILSPTAYRPGQFAEKLPFYAFGKES